MHACDHGVLPRGALTRINALDCWRFSRRSIASARSIAPCSRRRSRPRARPPDEVAKLLAGVLEKGAASRDRSGRYFNRRMVREAELRAKRSLAGKKGALHTNSKYFGFQHISRVTGQMPRQVPQQKSRAPPHPDSNKNKQEETEARQSTARARPHDQARPQAEQDKSAGSLATAPGGGALARPPGAEQDPP